jgi:hypothetical protein
LGMSLRTEEGCSRLARQQQGNDTQHDEVKTLSLFQ